VPFYLNCPHCQHPQIVPALRRGKAVFCRQCGKAYRTSARTNVVQALPISSISELAGRSNKTKKVYTLEV
jgi:transcription elongation factor Elf1